MVTAAGCERTAPPGRRIITPQRTYDRKTAAVGWAFVDGFVPAVVAAYNILQTHEVALLEAFPLGSATNALLFAGPVAEVRGATDKKWLMGEEVLGRFYKRKPLLGTACIDGPSDHLWSVMRDLKPMEIPDIDPVGERLTLAMVESLRVAPYLEGMEVVGRRDGLVNVGMFNSGSRHITNVYLGELDVAKEAKFAAKDHIRALMAGKKIDGEYDGSWFLVLGPEHHDLLFLLPWNSNPRPVQDVSGLNSYLAIESPRLATLLGAVNAAAWKASVAVIAPIELGSGTETAMLVSPNEDAVNEAAEAVTALEKNRTGDSSLLNVRVFHRPKAIFAANMAELSPAPPQFDMTGLSLGAVDTRDRGPLYDAVHELRRHADCRYIGMRKTGSRQAAMYFAGPQDEVEAALDDIEERAENEKGKKERCGELLATRIIENPHKQALLTLPWQKPSQHYTEAPASQLISNPYYKPGDPFAFVETLGMSHGLAIANYLFHEGVAPVSLYGVGSGLKVFHFAAEDYDLLTELLAWERLENNACYGMKHARDEDDGLNRMLVNVASYAEPGPIWQMIDQQQPVPSELYNRLLAKDVGVGVITMRGVDPTLYFLDQLKYFGVDLWGIEKTGGLHMTAAIWGSLGQIRDAIEQLSVQLNKLHAQEIIIELEHLKEDDPARQYKMQELYGWTRTWKVISNPHPNLAFFLPRGLRVGV